MQGNLKVAVICPVKFENRYLQEFVNCYKKLGFENVIIMDNNDKDGENPKDVLTEDIESGFVIIEDFRGQAPSTTNQNDMNQAVWDRYNQDYDWIAVFDADEYLELEPKYKDISDFLNRYDSDIDEIRVSWKMYGDNGMFRSPLLNDYRVEARFKDEKNISPVTQEGVTKAILRGKRQVTFNRICHACSHHGANINGVQKDVDVLGREVNHKSHKWHPVLQEAWLNHYRTKTLFEFVTTKAHRRTAENTDIPLSEYILINRWWRPGELKAILTEWGFKVQ